MLYFISDTHFGHNKEFIYGPRGFSNVDDMMTSIINNWNDRVTNDDDIYVLGDFALGQDLELVKEIIGKLNGRIHLVIGNHDTDRKIELYKSIDKVVEIGYALQIKHNGRRYYMSHYPTVTANMDSNPHNIVINLFGHTHSKDKFYEGRPYMYNVACDAHNCCPVSIEEIETDIKNEIDSCVDFIKEE